MSETAYCGSLDTIYNHNDCIYNQVKEDLSRAYLKSICSYLGVEFKESERRLDNDGIDGRINSPQIKKSGLINPRPSICVQLKCTSERIFVDDCLSFSIEVNYLNKIKGTSTNPCLLFVHILPEDVKKWVYISDTDLRMTEKMLWCNPSALNVYTKSDQKYVTLHIPLKNRVDENSIHQMLQMVSRGEEITNDLQ